MTGGTLQITNNDDFFRRYVEKVLTGEKQYIVELKTDTFKFYIDFDFKASEPLDDATATTYFIEWEKAVTGPVYIAKARPRLVDGLWKSGYHLIWPNKTVTKATYARMKNSIVLKTSPDVAEYIDEPTSGLRMLWSHKYPVGKPYIPWISIHNSKITNLETTPNSNMLKNFSIQAPHDEEVNNEPAESNEALENFIRKYIRGHEACNVKRIIRKGNDLIIQTDSTFCENLGGTHKSNHVWFLIRDGKIHQKCHCKCDVVRRKGKKCKDFTGIPHRIPTSILEELEPEPDDESEIINVLEAF
jgi:hypothetical protein